MKRRLDMLDGLRGFAIVLVFLNHIDSFHIAQAAPYFFRPFIHFLFTSGNLGVTFFFILSGFLMGFLYVDPQPRGFIERRYARIFPPFLVMVFCMWIFRLYPTLPLLGRVSIMLSCALLVRMFWIHIVERFHKGSLLISLFFLLQIGIAIWYGFFIMRRPPVWFDSLPFFLKEGTTLLVNGTLTLPLGNYIPLLDGVYWSLAPEMIFYLLYPFLFSPTVKALRNRGGVVTLFFVAASFPFFFGLSLIFRHSQGLAMLFIEYFIYFCGGIFIANTLTPQNKDDHKMAGNFLINPITFIALLFLSYVALAAVSGKEMIVVRLLLVIPFGYVVYSLVNSTSPLRALLENRIFLFLGTISYSMYIGHTAIVDGMHLIFKPKNATMNLIFLILTAGLFLLVSYAMHLIVERPYFQFKSAKKADGHGFENRKVGYGIVSLIIVFIFFSTYTSQFNFFSTQKKYAGIIPYSIKVSEVPYQFSFIAQEDNMGVILVHLTNSVGNDKEKRLPVDPLKPQKFQIRMKEKGAKNWYASQDTAPAEIGDSSSYPFGFPVIASSKNRTYVVEMSIKDTDYRSAVTFNDDEYDLQTVHTVPKRALLVNPARLMSHVGEKLQTAFSNPEAQLSAACIIPFFLLLFSL